MGLSSTEGIKHSTQHIDNKSFDQTYEVQTFAQAVYDSTNSVLRRKMPLVPQTYDYVSLSYTGDNLTGCVFKVGGSGGTTVGTLVLAYTGSNLTSVTRT